MADWLEMLVWRQLVRRRKPIRYDCGWAIDVSGRVVHWAGRCIKARSGWRQFDLDVFIFEVLFDDKGLSLVLSNMALVVHLTEELRLD